MVECWGMAAAVIAAHSEVSRDARMIREAKTPEEAAAVFALMRQRDERRHQLAVARASAPQVTIVNRIYSW